MNKLLISVITLILFTFSSQAAEKETVVLREWDNNKNVEYLEYPKDNNMDNLWSYTVKSVYGELQEKEYKGGYNISIGKYLMNCSEKLFILQKTYLFNNDELVSYKKYDEAYYDKDPGFGWKKLGADKTQDKIAEIFCK